VNTSPKGIAAVRPHFCDRIHAGQALARELRRFEWSSDVTVLGLACGGVSVAREVADALGAPLGVMVSRKIGVPGIEDVALGAVAEGSDRVVADSVAWYIGVPPHLVDRLAARERVEVERRARMYRAGQPMPAVKGRTVILVDDGVATGSTLRAAAFAIRNSRPRRIVAAVPIASRIGAAEVRADVDELFTVITPDRFDTIASWYEDYHRVSDDEVLSQLRRRRAAIMSGRGARSDVLPDVGGRLSSAVLRDDGRRDPTERSIAISGFSAPLMADFGAAQHVPEYDDTPRYARARGLVILANGGGSSRHGYRTRYMAGRFRLGGYATLRVDLLTREEQAEDGMSIPFDIARIAGRLTSVCEWALREGLDGAHRTILVGAGTGAAAALATAARRPSRIFAVIARSGRVEMAGSLIRHVTAPVLLIVGASDRDTLQRNGEALRALPRGAVLIRVPRASQMFAEPGALGAVAEQSLRWLDRLTRV
jgi:putative phosphoribosyl transferase